MPICPHCETRHETSLAPCPSGDGYHVIDEKDFSAFQGDKLLGLLISGRYVVTSVIGRGAIGRVYKGRQLNVDRDVVLKIFKLDNLLEEELGYNPSKTIIEAREDARDRFIREAKVLGQLSHPNCVTLYDFGISDDGALLYIAMEFVAGISLRQALKRGLKSAATLEIMHQILQALRQAHALDIVHRDLKPENIILSFRAESNEPVVKVLDFGIAKLVGKDHIESAHTTAGLLFGTPAYMSPEQCRGASAEIGPPSDIYALGCLFFELVTGALPFQGRTPQQMILMHQEQPVPSVYPRPGMEIPDGLAAFIKKCLAKKPADRYANAKEALRVLDALLDAWDGPSLQDERDASTFAEVHALKLASAGGMVTASTETLEGSSGSLSTDGITSTAHGETLDSLPGALASHTSQPVTRAPHRPAAPSAPHHTLSGVAPQKASSQSRAQRTRNTMILGGALALVLVSCIGLIYFLYLNL